MVYSGLILGFIVSKEGKILDLKKVQAIVNMPIPTNPQQIQVFNGMAQFYKCFIKNFAFIMAPITKLMRKIKPFIQTTKCQETWDQIKEIYMEAPILIPPNWQLEFHVHTNASLLAVGTMLAENPINKYDQLIVYASGLLNKTKQNYITIEREALVMVYALHKFRLFCWETNLFIMQTTWFGVLGQQTTRVRKDSQMVVVILRI